VVRIVLDKSSLTVYLLNFVFLWFPVYNVGGLWSASRYVLVVKNIVS